MSKLNFQVSAGLKDIIGKELITDKYVAIFELVKNAFDANSNKVNIRFNYNSETIESIDIMDFGCGMNYDQILNNWLNVAYSDKKQINAEKKGIKFDREQLGAKGIGRFSCDRVGAGLDLYSKTQQEELVHHIAINWDNFENNDDKSFLDIPVEYNIENNLDFPKHGTTIHISKLRENWGRSELLTLKKMLMKLISPNGDEEVDNFKIEIYAENEKDQDKLQISERDKVNGVIRNVLFESLQIKSVSLEVKIDEKGELLTTILNDKGREVFEIIEKNNFNLLKNIKLKLFYMNKAAKIAFAKIMGVAQASYGNIFVFKNGFRILPYGEPTDDFFDINRRQQQGTKRYFGTRDLVGRIEINGKDDGFVEVSSRDKGFINSRQVEALKQFFISKMKVLETYVVAVLGWGDNDATEFRKEDLNLDALIKQIAGLTKNSTPISINYDKTLIKAVAQNAKDNNIDTTLDKIGKIAEKSKNEQLLNLLNNTKRQVDDVRKENERLANLNLKHQKSLEIANSEMQRKDNQMYFLEQALDDDYIKAKEIIHLNMIFANKIIEYVDDILNETRKSCVDDTILDKLSVIKFQADKIYSISNFGLKSNFSLKSDIQTNTDIVQFIEEYVRNVYNRTPNLGMKIILNNETTQKIKIRFEASEIVCILENLISNSNKANAKNLYITFSNTDSHLMIDVADDGDGLESSIKNCDDVFSLGYTSTHGSGMGLYSIRKALRKINGTIEIKDTNLSFALRMAIRYGHKV